MSNSSNCRHSGELGVVSTLSPDAALTIAAALLNGPTEYLSLLLTQLESTSATRQPPATNQHTSKPENTKRRPE